MWFGEDQRAKSKHYNDTCSKAIGLHLQILITTLHSTLNSKHNCEVLCIQLKNQQTCTSDNHNKIRGGPIFNPFSFQMFRCTSANATRLTFVNLVGRSWGTFTTNQITATHLIPPTHKSHEWKIVSQLPKDNRIP
jgi:hypothetical protein